MPLGSGTEPSPRASEEHPSTCLVRQGMSAPRPSASVRSAPAERLAGLGRRRRPLAIRGLWRLSETTRCGHGVSRGPVRPGSPSVFLARRGCGRAASKKSCLLPLGLDSIRVLGRASDSSTFRLLGFSRDVRCSAGPFLGPIDVVPFAGLAPASWAG